MLTTTLPGLWVLQVLTGIETLAPELGLRPILPSVETKPLALAHPITEELRAAGVVDDAGVVDAAVVEWLTVLARRDMALVVDLRRPGGDEPTRAVIARFAQWWVLMERSAEFVRLGGAGTASVEGAASSVLTTQIDRLCGSLPPAPLRPATIDAEALAAGMAGPAAVRAFLLSQRLEPDQVQLIMLAVDSQRSAQASIVAIQAGVETGRPARTHVGQTAVTVIDTPAGRLVAEQVSSAGKRWLIVAPGTGSNISTAVNRMLRELPAEGEWHSYRKVV